MPSPANEVSRAEAGAMAMALGLIPGTADADAPLAWSLPRWQRLGETSALVAAGLLSVASIVLLAGA